MGNFYATEKTTLQSLATDNSLIKPQPIFVIGTLGEGKSTILNALGASFEANN